MSHKIELNGSTPAFVDNRTDAWHRLNNLPEEFIGKPIPVEVALRESHTAGWNVRKVPAFAALPSSNGVTVDYVPMPGQYATVRDNPWTPGQIDLLGSVGQSYVPVQNEDNIDVLQAIVDETGATIETCGSLREGRNVFVTMKLPDSMTVAGTDRLDLYLAGLNSHDGSSAYTLLATPVRIVCANTQNFALRNFQSKHVIRHTTNATKKIEAARQALGLSFKFLEEFQAEAERMLDATMTEGQFFEIVDQLWTPDEEPSKRAATIAKNRNVQLAQLFTEADTQANIRGTQWAGLQAVTEYLDHFAPVNNGERDAASARAERVLVGNVAVRQTAFDLFSVN